MTTETPEGGKLTECPVCRRNDHLGLKRVGVLTPDMPNQPYVVVCRDISHDEYSGPEGYGKDEALDLWNTRAS